MDVSDIGDIASVFGKVDVVATDPPYGRSASLWKEGKSSLYARAMDAFVGTVRTWREGREWSSPDHWIIPGTNSSLPNPMSRECTVRLSRHYFIFTGPRNSHCQVQLVLESGSLVAYTGSVLLTGGRSLEGP